MCWRSKIEKWKFTIGANAMERFYSYESSLPRASRMLRRHLDFLRVLSNGSPAQTVLPTIHYETSHGRCSCSIINNTKFLIILYYFYYVKLKMNPPPTLLPVRPSAINASNYLLYMNNIFFGAGKTLPFSCPLVQIPQAIVSPFHFL